MLPRPPHFADSVKRRNMSTIQGEPDAPAREIPATLSMSVPVVVYEDADGAYWARVPALPGCVSEGDTLDEVLANIREAAEGWLLANHDIQTGHGKA